MFVWHSLQLLSETFLITRKNEQDVIRNVLYIALHVKYPLFFSDFKETWVFSTDFRKTLNDFHENSFSGNRVVNGKTDGHDGS